MKNINERRIQELVTTRKIRYEKVADENSEGIVLSLLFLLFLVTSFSCVIFISTSDIAREDEGKKTEKINER